MKKLLLLICVLFMAKASYAQGFEKGTKNLNLGVGVGYGLGLNASVDLGITDVVSVGAVAGLSRRSYGVIGYNWRVNYMVVGGRVAAHVSKFLVEPLSINPDKIDTYIGITGGFRRASYDDSFTTYTGATTGVMLGGFVGARYQLTNALGIYVEAGSPFTTGGITFKF